MDVLVLVLRHQLLPVRVGDELQYLDRVFVHRALLVLEEWHLWQIAAQVLLSVRDLIEMNTGVGKHISDWLGLSSDVEVAEKWLVELVWAVLNTAGRLQFLCQILDGLLVTSNDALLFVHLFLQFRDFAR